MAKIKIRKSSKCTYPTLETIEALKFALKLRRKIFHKNSQSTGHCITKRKMNATKKSEVRKRIGVKENHKMKQLRVILLNPSVTLSD
jgi:hypothetical protein